MASQTRTGLSIKSACIAVVFVFLAAFVAIYGELFYEFCRGYYTGEYFGLISSSFSLGTALRTVLAFIACLALFIALSRKEKRIPSLLFKYRYVIALAVLTFCTIFEISGSSVACWSAYLSGSNEAGPIFGVPRPIRSDEWLVNLPMYLSQSFNDYASTTHILRGAETSLTMPIYAPSWSLATLFHPFQWGYLLFGSAKGVAFDWTASKLALLLVSFECAMLYTKKNKALSLAAAVLLSFSPLILWWNTGAPLVFGQGLVLALYCFINKKSLKTKIVSAGLLAWLAGCYLMILYPAWQVPFFFAFALFGIWVIIEYRSARKENPGTPATFSAKRDVPILLVFLLIVASTIAFAFIDAADALAATAMTAYPSGRVSTGGGLFDQLFMYGADLFLPLPTQTINASELSVMFTLFPLGLIAGSFQAVKNKDPLSAMLVCLEVVFLLYGFLGFPEWLSKITLFSYIPTQRLLFTLGCLDIFLLVRALSNNRSFALGTKPSCLIAIFAALGIFVLCLLTAPFEMVFAERLAMLLAVSLIVSTATAALLNRNDVPKRLFVITTTVVIITTGICVNPIQRGLGPLTGSNLYSSVESIVEDDPDGLWISENSVIANLCISAGAPTINSTNVYPNLDRWEQLDPDGEYRFFYNRYAHIAVSMQDSAPTSMYLIQADSFGIELNWFDLKKLGVEYLITQKEYPDNPGGGINLTLLAQENGFNIYKVS